MTVATTSVIRIAPSELKDFKGGNTRRKRNPESFAELIESVRHSGFIHMPVARPSDDGGYELVVGHNRRDAAIELGIGEIDVDVRELSDKEAMAMHLEENLVREGLSFSDQVDAARRWVSFFNGDRESAAKRMSWSLKQLNERMELVNCIDAVMEALDDGAIGAGHALILSTMPEKLQNGSLKTIIAEKLTVAELRKRAAKIQLPLASAKFDKADCQGCQHNSEKQAGLFGTADDAAATCSNGSCYRQKTQEHLADTRAELEEKFGKVLFVTESLSSDRNTVAIENVGQKQFETGCMGCESRAALLDDRPTREGVVLESQCLNTDCFRKCADAFVKAKAQAEKAATEKSASPTKANAKQSSTEKTPANTAGSSKASTTVAYTPNNAVIEQHKAEVTAFSRKALVQHESFRLAIVIASLEHTVSGARDIGSSMSLGKRIPELATMEKPELLALLSATVTKAIEKGAQFGSATDFSVFSESVKALSMQDEATKAWIPTETGLKPYTIEGIKSVCSAAGVDATEVGKMAKSGKGAFVKAVVAADFDWTDFAPAAYTNLLK